MIVDRVHHQQVNQKDVPPTPKTIQEQNRTAIERTNNTLSNARKTNIQHSSRAEEGKQTTDMAKRLTSSAASDDARQLETVRETPTGRGRREKERDAIRRVSPQSSLRRLSETAELPLDAPTKKTSTPAAREPSASVCSGRETMARDRRRETIASGCGRGRGSMTEYDGH